VTDEERNGLYGLGRKLIGALPAGMLVVVIVVAGLFWHLSDQLDAREKVLMELIKACGH